MRLFSKMFAAVYIGAWLATCGSLVAGDSLCTALDGVCQENSIPCLGGYESGKCSGGATRQCCKPAAGDGDCISWPAEGFCRDDSQYCAGYYLSGMCAGNSARRCCTGPPIVSRASWGARSPNSTTSISVPVDRVFIHHTTGSHCTNTDDCKAVVRRIQNYHMDTKEWSDIAYSFLVGEDGNVYEGRGWEREGAHTSGYNSVSIAISFIGNFMNTLPNSAALRAAKNLLTYGLENNNNKIASTYRLGGHRDATGSSTSCPGDALYAAIKTWPNYNKDM